MIDNCNIKDINRINYLGNLLNPDFYKLNDINSIIDNKEIIGYYKDNELVGILVFKKLYEVIDILYLIVDKKFRKQGIGTKLINYLKKLDYERIMLEVDTSNIEAINLYKKNGFNIINERKQYYKNNNAFVMEAKK